MTAQQDQTVRQEPAAERDTTEKAAPKPLGLLRPVRYHELPQAYALIQEAIETSPYYSPRFKALESARLNMLHLERTFAADPSHILVFEIEREIVGCMLSSPEYGTLWLLWSYLKPEHRRGPTALGAMRGFIEHFDNGRFHKIATYTKTGNRSAEAVMKRYGYKHICTLENHIFGEDYLLYERPLNKIEAGYDTGIAIEGRLGRLKRRMFRWLGLLSGQKTAVAQR